MGFARLTFALAWTTRRLLALFLFPTAVVGIWRAN